MGARNGVFLDGASGFPTQSFNAANYWVDVVLETGAGPDETAPLLTTRQPAADATNVVLGATVRATFNEALDPASVDAASFELRDSANALVPGAVSYVVATRHCRVHAIGSARAVGRLHGDGSRRRPTASPTGPAMCSRPM